jgi:hypothetical protein
MIDCQVQGYALHARAACTSARALYSRRDGRLVNLHDDDVLSTRCAAAFFKDEIVLSADESSSFVLCQTELAKSAIGICENLIEKLLVGHGAADYRLDGFSAHGYPPLVAGDL